MISQEGLEDQRLPLTEILRASIALGNVSMVWRGNRVIFVPKLGREGYTAAKDFRQMSLTNNQ